MRDRIDRLMVGVWLVLAPAAVLALVAWTAWSRA